MKTILALLLLASFTFAQWQSVNGCITNSTLGVFQEQGMLIGIVVLFTVVLIACAYMVGSAFSEIQWTVFAKDELYHLGFSIVFLLAFSGILAGSCLAMQGFYSSLTSNFGAYGLTCANPNYQYTMQGAASCYMDKLSAKATSISETYVNRQISEMMDSTFAWSFALPLVDSHTLTGDAYKRVRSTQYETILNYFLIPALVSINMQKLMLSFISENIIQWVLPVAFLLRIFVPTRQMGDLLIAFCVGVYVIIPFMYVFNFSMYDVIGKSDCQTFSTAICDRVVDGSCDNRGDWDASCDNPIGFWSVGKLIPFAFFLPNLTIVILVAFMSAVHSGLRAIG